MLGMLAIATIIFVAVKFVAYRYVGIRLNSLYGRVVTPWLFGLARTLLGIVVGAAYTFIWEWLTGDLTTLTFLFPLVLIVLAEWLFVVWLFFERHQEKKVPNRILKYSAVASLLSLSLDLLAILPGVAGLNSILIC